MTFIHARSFVAVLVATLALGLLPGCENPEEDIDITVSELEDASARRNGGAFVALLAPESFTHYDRMIQLALNATPQQLQSMSIMDKLDIVMMRNRTKRKDLEAMDGKAWIAKAISEGWYAADDGGDEGDPGVHERNITVRGSTATVEIIYDARWGLFQGADSLERVRDTMSFIKVDDRWLYDYRRQSELMEKYIGKVAAATLRTPEQVIESIESDLSDKDVRHDIWEPMK